MNFLTLLSMRLTNKFCFYTAVWLIQSARCSGIGDYSAGVRENFGRYRKSTRDKSGDSQCVLGTTLPFIIFSSFLGVECWFLQKSLNSYPPFQHPNMAGGKAWFWFRFLVLIWVISKSQSGDAATSLIECKDQEKCSDCVQTPTCAWCSTPVCQFFSIVR